MLILQKFCVSLILVHMQLLAAAGGKNVRKELAQCVADLPDIFEQVLTVLPNLVLVITYYQKFILHTTGRSPGDTEFLPMLSFILKRGNVTVYEWKYGEPPPVQKLEQAATQTEDDELVSGSGNGELEIDWGDGDNATISPAPQLVATSTDSQPADGIDFGESGIDFGESGIDFGESEVEIADDQLEIVLEGSGEEGGVTETKENGHEITIDLQPLLGHIETRNQFLDDIQELREFLMQRSREMGDDGSSSHLLLQQFSRGTEAIGLQSQETIEEMLGHVNQVLDVLTSPRTQHLFLIQGSTTYLDRLADSLLQSKQLAGKAATQVEVYAGRREEAANLAISLEPKLRALVSQTKELQSQIAADISKRYSNRVVNIMGEINHI